MRGSIRKRGSTYTYWLDIGPDPVTGKRRQRTKGGFRTKRECQAALNDAIAAVQGGTFVEPSIHNILHRALKDAVRWGYLVRNVADAADPPRGKSAEMRVWNPSSSACFWSMSARMTCMPSGC